jgi:hypothetical protein
VSRMIRSRRADVSRDQPMYARLLRLQHLSPSGFLCFVFLEGAVALGFLLALAELVSWWGVLVLPITVALMVKLNDVLAGSMTRTPVTRPAAPPSRPLRPAAPPAASGPQVPSAPRASEFAMDDLSLSRARTVDLRNPDGRGVVPSIADVDASALNGPPTSRTWTDDLDLREQRARQSAARRYE